jgi:hypothetical protein
MYSISSGINAIRSALTLLVAIFLMSCGGEVPSSSDSYRVVLGQSSGVSGPRKIDFSRGAKWTGAPWGTSVDSVNYLAVEDRSPELLIWNTESGYTIEYWFRSDDLSLTALVNGDNPPAPVGPGNHYTAGNYGWGFGPTSDGRVAFNYHAYRMPNEYIASPPGSITAGQWHHIAAVGDSRGMSIFVDGEPKVNGLLPAGQFLPYSEPLGLVVGAYHHSWDAYIKELRISAIKRYSKKFNPSKIKFTADDKTLLLLHFDEPIGTTNFSDSSFSARTVINPGVTKVFMKDIPQQPVR